MHKQVYYLIFLIFSLSCQSQNQHLQQSGAVDISPLLIKDSLLLEQINMQQGHVTLLDTNGSRFIEITPENKNTIATHYRCTDFDSLFRQPSIIKTKSSCETQDSTIPNLNGMKIAIDAGHMAGDIDMAKIEERYIEFKKGSHPLVKRNISFFEANLTMATAYLLQQKLEKQGAEILLSREGPGVAAFNQTFDDWWTNSFRHGLNEALELNIIEPGDTAEITEAYRNDNKRYVYHKLFKYLDFYHRASKINDFNPDITIVIHYNVDIYRNEKSKPSDNNYCMAFVPGSFMEGELSKPEELMEFTRLITTDDIEKSVELSSFIVQSFNKVLNIPIADNDSIAFYLKNYCLSTSETGVYSRNLSLTRMVHGPVCYGETIFQDNVQEALRLNDKSLDVNGIVTSNRVAEVAEAYYQGIKNYVLHLKKE